MQLSLIHSTTMKKFLALVALTFLVGCATTAPSANTKTLFNNSDFDAYRAKGTGKVVGQAFLKTVGGDVKVAAGDKVSLTPATALIKEMRDMRNHGIEPANFTQDVLAKISDTFKNTIADAQGNFEFTDLPSGEYLLEVNIEWGVAGQYGVYNSGHLVCKYVTVTDGATAKVILTD